MLTTLKAAADRTNAAYWAAPSRETLEAAKKAKADYEAALEQAIARDLDMCDLGEVLTTGRTRAKYRRQRKACFAEIRRMNRADGLDMSDDELLAELTA